MASLLLLFSCPIASDFVTPWTAACQASLSLTISYKLLKVHFILWRLAFFAALFFSLSKRGSIDYHFLGTPSDSSVITLQGSSHGLDKTLSLLYSGDSRKWLGEVCPWKENRTVSVVRVLASLGPQSSHVL